MSNLGKLTFVLDAKMAGLEQKLDTADKRMRGFAASAEKANQAAARSFDTLKQAALGFFTVTTAREVLQIADSYQMLQSRIRSATDSMQSYTAASTRLYDISQATGSTLENNVALFQRLKIGAAELGRSDIDVLKLVEAVNKLGVIGGASQAEIGNASTQLSQAMAGGIVRAEEFNSIVENTPMLAKAIADGLDTSMGALRQMVIDGKLLADDVFTAVLSQTDKIDAKFGALGPNMARGMQSATTAVQEFIGKLDAVYGFTKTIGQWLEDWAESVHLVSLQIERSKIYDQAEVVNKVQAAAIDAQAPVDETRRMLTQVMTSPELYKTLETEEARLAAVQKQLALEKERLDVLSKQELMTNQAMQRLGVEPPAPTLTGATGIDMGGLLIKTPGSTAAAAATATTPKTPAAAKRRADEGFQDFAGAASAEAYAKELAALEQYRQGQLKAVDSENEVHTKRMAVLEDYAKRNTELHAMTNATIEAEQTRHAKAMELIETTKFTGQLDAVKSGLGNLATLMNSSSRKAFEVGKVAAIAMATINGIQATVASFKWGAEIGGPVLGAIFAATAAAATLVQIQQLKSAQFGGGGFVSAGSTGAAPNTYQPPQPTQPVGPVTGAESEGRSVNIVFNGPVNGFDVAGLAEQIGQYINQSDTIFIDSNSRTGLQFATAI